MVNNSSNSMMLDEAFFGDQVIKVEGNADTKLNFLKRPNSLRFNDSENPIKKPKSWELTSPDVKKLNMDTPEIERFMENPQIVLGPNVLTVSSSLFSVSDDDKFSQPFLDELENLRNKDSNSSLHAERPPLSSSGSNSSEYMSEPHYSELLPSNDFTNMIPNHFIKEERIVPNDTSSPPMSPINMESQEKIKLERKRQRNRVAASKCRRRKLERIAKLEEKVKALKTENNDLSSTLARLMNQICTLKQTIVAHTKSGCDFAPNYL